MNEVRLAETPILGIHRLSELTSQNGECIEIINLRPREEKVWEPIPPPDVIEDFSTLFPRTIDHVVRHYAAGDRAYAVATGADLYFVKDGEIVQASRTGKIETLTAFQNTILATHRDDFNNLQTITFLYRPENKAGEQYIKLPETFLPEFTFERETQAFRADDSSDIEEALANYMKKVKDLSEDGFHTGHALLAIGFRLADDSQFMYSHPVYLPLSYRAGVSPYKIWANLAALGGTRYQFGFPEGWQWDSHYASKITLSYIVTQQLKDIIASYKDIITALEVYAYHVPDHYGYTTDLENDYEAMHYPWAVQFKYLMPKDKLVNEGLKDFFDAPTFFRVHEISSDEILRQDNGLHTAEISLKDIVGKRQVTLNNFSNHHISGENTKTINNRLHLSRINTILGKGTDPTLKISKSGLLKDYPGLEHLAPLEDSLFGLDKTSERSAFPDPELKYQFLIRTTSGIRVVEKQAENVTLLNTLTGGLYVSPGAIISYPDKRAYKVRVFYENKLIAEHNLKANPYNNYASFLPELEASNNEYLVKPPLYNLHAEPIADEAPQAEFRAIYENNRLQVSETDNPLVFPAALSFRFDQDTVRSVAAVAETISEGQFGAFPLFVFTSNNIWALRQSDPDVTYSQQVLVRREQVSSDTVLPIPGGVAFFAGGKLKIIWRNQKVREASEPLKRPSSNLLREKFEEVLKERKLAGANIEVDGETVSLESHDLLTNPEKYLSHVRFDKYTQEGSHLTLIFNDNENELIVSNPEYKYSYVYNVSLDVWYKITNRFHSNPLQNGAYGFWGAEIFSFYDIPPRGGAVLLGVGGTLLGTNAHKKIQRSILRASITGGRTSKTGFYSLGSFDGSGWTLSGGSERTGSPDKGSDYHVKRLGQSFRWLSWLFAGYILPGSQIGTIQSEVQTRYQNRTR